MFSKLLIGGLLALVVSACSDPATSRVTRQTQDESASAQADEADGTFEFAQARAHRVPPRIQRFDANKDGVLTPNEIPQRLQAWFAAVDANGDKVVTADEIRAYNKAHPHPHRHHHGQGQGGHQQQQSAPPAHVSETTL